MHDERERPEDDSPASDDADDAAPEENNEVDEASKESFPASDPPSY